MQECNMFTWNFNEVTTASKVGGGSRDNKQIVKLPWKLRFRDYIVRGFTSGRMINFLI